MASGFASVRSSRKQVSTRASFFSTSCAGAPVAIEHGLQVEVLVALLHLEANARGFRVHKPRFRAARFLCGRAACAQARGLEAFDEDDG